jgi:hypothetical protein
MSFRSQIYATLIVRLPKHFQPLFTSLEPLLSTLTLATIFSVVVSVIAIGILCYPLLVKWQRDRLMAKQFPKSWLSIIESNLSIYKSLTSEQQKELLGYIQVFLKEKQFIGCHNRGDRLFVVIWRSQNLFPKSALRSRISPCLYCK